MNRSGDMAPTDLPLENAISADFEGSPLSLVAGEITGEELQQDGVYGSPSAAVNFSFDSHDSEQMHSGNNSSLEMNSSWTSIMSKTAGMESISKIIPERKARLVLEDGSVHYGYSFGYEGCTTGEVVFNTGMVGYPESLTDPSYKGQILVLTYPIIGNYGVPDRDAKDEWGLAKYFESDSIQISALIVCDYSHDHCHWNAKSSLSEWLKEEKIPALYGLDTRALTKKIRIKGAMLGKIEFGNESIQFANPNEMNLVAQVSRKEPQIFGNGPTKIIAVDCGMKNNIIRYFMRVSDKITLKVVPWNYDFNNEDYDGLFISNGPGNPQMASLTIEHLRVALAKDRDTPIFGICLGNQLLALAAGAKTYKMKFGNRGMNQPCIDLRTTLCYITPQNHGFAVDTNSLPKDWEPLFVNANDDSNEGITHSYKPFFSVQFHPEANGGPHDTSFLFKLFLDRIKYRHPNITTISHRPLGDPIHKVILLGSGGLSIGQAGEFDYSGSQAIKALKEENIFTVLVNPNIATIQTSAQMADKVYFLPVTPEFVTEVIKKERPDAILLQFGGQTALNCGIQLQDRGILKKYDVRVLGTPIETIRATEDREIFSQKLHEIGESLAPSDTAYSIDEAIKVAESIGYPVLVRAAFALGGLGSGFAENKDALIRLAEKAFSASNQIIIDKSLRGWKEVEYEVVRDVNDNCITVCNMENFDPLGIHTGDSIVIAPSQTLSNEEYYALRATAIKTIRHLGVVGECNIQYALDPHSLKYCIIEVNARLSRSSALASKATGYPLAYVACKLALGKALTDIRNSVTKKTTACFEPSLDYVVVKIPRWDLKKFTRVSSKLGSSMMSVGEVMSIGKTFEESFQKAVRMLGGCDGFGDIPTTLQDITQNELEEELRSPSDNRLFIIGLAMIRGYTVDQIHSLTSIDKWFLHKLQTIVDLQKVFQKVDNIFTIPTELLWKSKKLGFSDKQLARCGNSSEFEVRKFRQQLGVKPFVKQIDTLAAEFPAQTNYLYMTYNGIEHDLSFEDRGICVLGCGAYRIGSSCEFDWCAVSALRTLKSMGHKSVMINYNPETVSTDYDESDKLYFEELTLERVLDIYEVEQSSGIIISVGGQIANNLALPLHRQGVRILGTHPNAIDNAEDRHKFSALLDTIGIDQPLWKQLTTLTEAKAFAEKVGYPVLVRPSYVLSGAAMSVAYNPKDLEKYLTRASLTEISQDAPVVISKFIIGAKEIEIDAVAKDGKILNYAISEHVENAGVHSGDATLVLPAQKLYVETVRLVKKCAANIAENLHITGPFNIQFLSKDNEIKVIECNLRASRSFPFVSKTFNVNFIELATKAMIGAPVRPSQIDLNEIHYVNIKAPMFSFTRLQGADPILSVEMASTGEVACLGETRHEAYLKALFSSGFKMPKRNILISVGPLQSKLDIIQPCKIFHKLGFKLFATPKTAEFLAENNLPVTILYKPSAGKSPSALEYLTDKKIELVINIPDSTNSAELTDGYLIRRKAVDFSISLITNIKSAILFANAIDKVKKIQIRSWDEYLRESKLML